LTLDRERFISYNKTDKTIRLSGITFFYGGFYMGENKDWVPDGIKAFGALADNFCTRLVANAAAWGVNDTDKNKTTALKAAYDAAQALANAPATRTVITIAAAKKARKALEAHMRYLKRVYIDPGFESGVLTRSDYISLGLTPHASTHTPVAVPTSRPQLFDVKELGGFAVEVYFKDEHIEHSQAVPYGYNGCFVNYYYGPEQVTDVKQLPLTQLFTASPAHLQLPPEAEGMWLSIVPRWQRARGGRLGPWGTIEHVRVT
jgi:hypothetical protein